MNNRPLDYTRQYEAPVRLPLKSPRFQGHVMSLLDRDWITTQLLPIDAFQFYLCGIKTGFLYIWTRCQYMHNMYSLTYKEWLTWFKLCCLINPTWTDISDYLGSYNTCFNQSFLSSNNNSQTKQIDYLSMKLTYIKIVKLQMIEIRKTIVASIRKRQSGVTMAG